MLSDEQLAGLLILPLALIGAVANWTVTLLIPKIPSLKNAFGKLTTSQALADALHGTIFILWFCPMCIFDIEVLKTYSSVCGHVLLIVYDISTYSHLCISLNRFCAIWNPIKYNKLFSMESTQKVIIFSWALAIIPPFYLYVYNDCKFYYTDTFWVFTFSTTPVCLTITWYWDFVKFNSIVLLIVIIDVITVSRVRSYKAGMSATACQSQSKKKSSEMNFLKQACLQAFVFVCELVTYFLITPRVPEEERMLRCLLSTVAWVMVHVLDGIITLSFNREFTQFIIRGVKIENLTIPSMTHASHSKF